MILGPCKAEVDGMTCSRPAGNHAIHVSPRFGCWIRWPKTTAEYQSNRFSPFTGFRLLISEDPSFYPVWEPS